MVLVFLFRSEAVAVPCSFTSANFPGVIAIKQFQAFFFFFFLAHQHLAKCSSSSFSCFVVYALSKSIIYPSFHFLSLLGKAMFVSVLGAFLQGRSCTFKLEIYKSIRGRSDDRSICLQCGLQLSCGYQGPHAAWCSLQRHLMANQRTAFKHTA